MNELLFSNDELGSFRHVSKRVTNPNTRWIEKRGRHRQRNYVLESDNGEQYRIYLRQNLDDSKDFSCGLALIYKSGKNLTLVRYNGASHIHGTIRYKCHIHLATAEALHAGKKIESYAEETKRYKTLNGALACMIEDCSVQGLEAQHDEMDLFDES